MIAAFSSLYGGLKGFFERSFWFGAFLPVLLFASAHAILYLCVIGTLTLPGLTIGLSVEPHISDLATAATVVCLVLIVAAYALAPLLPLLRGLVDGTLLPAFLHDWFRTVRLTRAKAAWDRIEAARNELSALKSLAEDAHSPTGKLVTAYADAERLESALDEGAVQSAKQALEQFNTSLFNGSGIEAVAGAATEAVVRALNVNCPNADNILSKAQAEEDRATRTNALADDLEDMLTRGKVEAAYRYKALRSRYRLVGALTNPQATPVGDARFVVEQYSDSVYGVRFSFLWPRMIAAMKAAKADDPDLEAIDNAKSEIDFATLSLFFTASVPLVWLPVMLFTRSHVWLFLAIGFSTPPVLVFFHNLAFEAQLALSEVAKVNIDRSRLLVVQTFQQPEPRSRSEERLLWQRLAAAEENPRRAELLYIAVQES